MPRRASPSTPPRRRALLALALLLLATTTAAAPASPRLTVVASGLANPRKLTVAPDGALYVAEAGRGGRTGTVARIANGRVTRVVTGLCSFGAKHGASAQGPAAVALHGTSYDVLLQDGAIDHHGRNKLGPACADAGDLVRAPAGRTAPEILFDFAAFEAAHNPDHGAGPGPKYGDPPIGSDPYALAAYRGGYVVADASGNDLLWIRHGHARLLAVFPTRRVRVSAAAARLIGVRAGSTFVAQAVPDSVAVGPDGALYVGELTGVPYAPGTARIWRVVPGHEPTVYASGFTNVADLAFDGRDLLVLEIAAHGFVSGSSRGALIRVSPAGRKTTVASDGLVDPTGLAVVNGRAYVSNHGRSATKGQIIAFSL